MNEKCIENESFFQFEMSLLIVEQMVKIMERFFVVGGLNGSSF